MTSRGQVQSANISHWLDVMRAIVPCKGCMLVGAGAGTGPLVQWLLGAELPQVVLVEADVTSYRSLQRNVPSRAEWSIMRALVAPLALSTSFHIASNPAESGLLKIDALKGLWPNLEWEGVVEHHAPLTAGELLSCEEHKEVNWLIVDCLPAAAILEGTVVDQLDVLIARVVLDDQLGIHESAGLAQVSRWMESQGMRLVRCAEERHPGLGHAIFVRDVRVLKHRVEDLHSKLEREGKSLIESLARCDALNKENADFQAALDAEAKARAAEASAKAEALARCDALNKENADLQTACDAEAKARAAEASAKAEALARCDALNKENADLQTACDAEAKARAAEASAKAEALARCDALNKENADFQAACDAEAKARAAEASAKAEALTRCDALSKENADFQAACDAEAKARAAEASAKAEALTRCDALNKENADLQTACDAEAKARAAEASAKAEALARCDALNKENADLQTACDAEAKARAAEASAKAEALARCDALNKENADLQTACDAEAKARAAEASAKAEALARCDALNKENADLQTACDAEAKARAAEASAKAEALARCDALNKENADFQAALDAEAKARAAEASTKAETLARQETLLDAVGQLERRGESQERKLEKLGQSVEAVIQREVGNALKQMEAFSTLQGYMTTGEIMPAFHGWPVSPDFGLLLVQLIEQNDFDAIIEFGSGSSTVLIARTLAHLANKQQNKARPIQVAFEHLEAYHLTTTKHLLSAGLKDEVMLVHAPLKETTVESGEIYNYYDPGTSLEEVRRRLGKIRTPRILAVVDGPPETTGPLARYPALEMLLEAFPSQHGFFLLDDFRRAGEQEIARKWQQMLDSRRVVYDMAEYPLEKMACLITLRSGTARTQRTKQPTPSKLISARKTKNP